MTKSKLTDTYGSDDSYRNIIFVTLETKLYISCIESQFSPDYVSCSEILLG